MPLPEMKKIYEAEFHAFIYALELGIQRGFKTVSF